MTQLRPLLPLLFAIIGLCAIFGYWIPDGRFLTAGNLVDLAQQISVNAILAFGLTLVILIGGIDLSVGAMVAFAGVVCVSMLEAAGLWGSLLAALGVAALFGAAIGYVVTSSRMPAFIVTLAIMLVLRGLALGINEGRPLPVPDDQSWFLAIGNARIVGWLPVPVVVMIFIFGLMAVLLHMTRFGQHLFAIGGNREAARFTGIAIARHEIAVYSLCGLCAGIAGMLHASQLYSAEPASGLGFELTAIAAVVVGGTSFTGGIGTMLGTLVGATIIGILDKGLNQAGVHFSLQYIVKGFVILLAVYIDLRRKQ